MARQELHPTLARLERLADRLWRDDGVVALLGLGSAGRETSRFDEHSDIDFVVVVGDVSVKTRYIADIRWLSGFGGEVVFTFIHDPNGRKALLADGLLLEYAVLTPDELAGLPISGARVVRRRPGFIHIEEISGTSGAPNTVEFHNQEALTNLYVGLHRELRGERLTAMRFIQVYALNQVLALLRLEPETSSQYPDRFEPTRRVERSGLGAVAPLAQMAPGYEHNAEAAAITLRWLRQRYDQPSAMVEALERLLHQANAAKIR